MINPRLLERLRDVALVLYACKGHGQLVGRFQLQKLVYLVDALAICHSLLTPSKGHHVYFNGPYDEKIQRAADILVFRGLANASDVTVRTNGHISCRYEITPVGLDWVDSWRNTLPSLSSRSALVHELINAIAYRNAFSNLRNLVYSEPTFSALRSKGNGYRLELMSVLTNLTAQFVGMIERSFNEDEGRLTTQFLVELYLEFLESRRQLI